MNTSVATPDRQRITILLCTFEGGAHLEAQLQSYLIQTYEAWDLWVSDDGSRDGTWAILEQFQKDHGLGRDIRLLKGPQQGGTANFLTLLCHPDLPQGPVALSDQDDVWLPDKLSRAITALARAAPIALYGAQSLHCDAALRVIGRSRRMSYAPSFGNALVQNIVSGHSATLSAGGLELVRRAGVQVVPFHDWWLYQLIAGAGGDVVIDSEPVLFYRQHAANTMGAHRGLRAKLRRAGMVMGRCYGYWVATNVAALGRIEPLLSPQSRVVLAALACQNRRPGLGRLRVFIQNGIYRQTRMTTAFLYLAVILGRV